MVQPLAAVLARMGLPRGSPERVLQGMGGTWEGVDDARVLAREILGRLGEKLASLPPEDIPPCLVEDADSRRGPRPDLEDSIRAAPDRPGVYTFVSRENQVLYVGKARSLRRRLVSHFHRRGVEPEKRAILVREAESVRWEATGSELEALLREHGSIHHEQPLLNTQRAAHQRRRGSWRERTVALVLPSVERGRNELCLLAGDGRFHWERVPRAERVPRQTWSRVVGFLAGTFPGWPPGQAGHLLEPYQARELAEIALTWLAVHEPQVTRVDLSRESGSQDLRARLRRALAVNAAGERVEIR
jgi:hypothetical protein